MRRLYESTFIVNSALEDMDIEAVVTKVTSYIENQGGEVKVVERWGRRRLAYPINKKFNGFYVYVEFEIAPANLPVIERFYILDDTILRHLTLILPIELKELRERKSLEKGKISNVPFDEEAEKKKQKEEKTTKDKSEEKRKDSTEETTVKETKTEATEAPAETTEENNG